MRAWILWPGGALAHHSQSFFADEITEFSGTLANLEWRNPHVVVRIDVANERGEIEPWRFEGDSIYVLQGGNVTRDSFEMGHPVRVAAYRSVQTPREGLIVNLLRADGVEVLLHTRARVRWSDEVVGENLAAPVPVVLRDTAQANKGIFRVWSSPRPADRIMHLPFTEAAIEARAAFDLTDNFATRCEPEGMPRIMRNPHPFEFVDEGDRILIRSELYDLVRVVHMGQAVPVTVAATPLGYSVGAWDGEVLVVRTNHVSWPYFDNIGTPQSGQTEIVERFSLSEDQSRLDYHITVTDPATFTEPATIEGRWLALGEVIQPYECTVY